MKAPWLWTGCVALFLACLLVLQHTGNVTVIDLRGKSKVNYVSAIPAEKQTASPTGYDITVVTMYLNIGSFKKGYRFRNASETYIQWMHSFAWLNNTVVAFLESDKHIRFFIKIRSFQPPERTIVYKIHKKDLQAFRNVNKISRIFANESYPKWHPNTVRADYACVQHAKVDVLEQAIKDNRVRTKYITWLDIGYFRNLNNPEFYPANKTYKLEVPLEFNDSKLAVSEVGSDNILKSKPWDIIKNNDVWMSGGFLLSTPKVMTRYIRDFRLASAELLADNMTSTDQQVAASLYTRQLHAKPSVDIQRYNCCKETFGLEGFDLVYFCLGFRCKHAAEVRANCSSTT